MKTKNSTNSAKKRKHPKRSKTAASPWEYFTLEGMIYSQGVDIFVPNVDLAQHAVPLDIAFPLRLKHAQDFWVMEASHDVIVVMPFEIQFRMLKTHAGKITDEEIAGFIREVDLRDGKLDGKDSSPSAFCPSCSRRLLGRGHKKCLWCGAELPQVTAAKPSAAFPPSVSMR